MIQDVCKSRHGGNPESQQAFDRVQPSLSRRQNDVLTVILFSGLVGATCREIADKLDKGMNSISPRLTELAARGDIKRNGQRREGGAVWVTVENDIKRTT